MSRIHVEDELAVDGMFWCYEHQQNVCLMKCPDCECFPCPAMTPTTVRTLQFSPLFDKTITGLVPIRRTKMFIALLRDGSFKEVDIDINNPDPVLLSDVVEVHEIKKTYIPTVTLKPKPAAARAAIKAASGEGTASAEAETEAPKRRTRKKAV